MKRIASTFWLAAFATLAGHATAQAPTTTDEARALAAQATAEHVAQSLWRKPVAEPVAIGDYRAQAHQAAREAHHRAELQNVDAYINGVRSPALQVSSEDSARAEAQRRHAEQDLGRRTALLQASPLAQLEVQAQLAVKEPVATR
jgi:hypothetical protein